MVKFILFGEFKHLGDPHDIEFPMNFDSRHDYMEKGAEYLAKHLKAAIVKPIHIYQHSGASVSTSYSYPYDCRWDSGTCGFAVVTKESIKNHYGVKRVTAALIERADKRLEARVKALDSYLQGDED